jgi:hypothetical protein
MPRSGQEQELIMNPNPSGSAIGVVVRTLALALAGLVTASDRVAVFAAIIVLVVVLTAAVVVIMRVFAGLTKARRDAVTELVRAMRRSGK